MLEAIAENVLLILRVDESCSDLSMRANKSHNKSLILRSTELSNAKRREPLPGAPVVDVLPPIACHGVIRDSMFGLQRMQDSTVNARDSRFILVRALDR